MTIPPAISPDGGYWWDGAVWQPMPKEEAIPGGEAEAEAAPAPEAEAAPISQAPAIPPEQLPLPPAVRPDWPWLPDDIPIASAPKPSTKIFDTAPPVGTIPSPSWTSRAPRIPSRRVILIALVVVLALLAVGEGVLAVRHFGVPTVRIAGSPTPKATPSPIPSPSPSPIAGPLTALIVGTPCPVAHVGDPACWKVTFTNTGPAITKLVMIVDTDRPYTNWFEHHTGASLAGTDPSAGCDLDLVRVQVVCGPVPVGGHFTLRLSGFVANVGSYQYGVRFGDIASGFLADVDLNPDGSPDVFTWNEVIK